MLALIGAILLWVLKVVLVLIGLVVVACILAFLVASIEYWKQYTSVRKSWPYDTDSTERLWAYVITASTAITMILLFAFLQITDAMGFYLLWTPSALIGYFVIAFIIATKLHVYYSDGVVWDLPVVNSDGVVWGDLPVVTKTLIESTMLLDESASAPPVSETVVEKTEPILVVDNSPAPALAPVPPGDVAAQ